MYIEISNTGQIDIEAFKLLGASTKTSSSDKIGCFGSGLKYAIAYLLRHNLEFFVYSGLDEVKFDLQKIKLRDQEFSKIVVNGSETSITTSWGKNWNKWQIFREIVANGMDEEDFIINKTKSINPEANKTKFYLKYNDFQKYYNHSNIYFLNDYNTLPVILDKKEINKLIVYKKGVRVVEEEEINNQKLSLPDSLFNYRLETINLDEERIASKWEIDYEVAKLLVESTDVILIKKLLKNLNNSKLYENTLLSTDTIKYFTLSNEWLTAIESLDHPFISKSANIYIDNNKTKTAVLKKLELPDSLYAKIENTFKSDFTNNVSKTYKINSSFEELDITNKQVDTIKKSLSLLQKAGFKIEQPIKVVKFIKDKKTTATIEDNNIILSEELFNESYLEVVANIFEQSTKLQNNDHGTEELKQLYLKLFTNLLDQKYNQGLRKFF